jgi:hypothetical protein
VEPFEGLFGEEGTDVGGDFEVSHSKYGAPLRSHSGQGARRAGPKTKKGRSRLLAQKTPALDLRPTDLVNTKPSSTVKKRERGCAPRGRSNNSNSAKLRASCYN